MSDLKESLIKLGYEKPELRDHIRPVIDRLTQKEASMEKEAMNLFQERILDVKGFFATLDNADPQIQDLMTEIYRHFSERFKLPPNEENALNRLLNLCARPNTPPEGIRNQVAKIANELGMKTPLFF